MVKFSAEEGEDARKRRRAGDGDGDDDGDDEAAIDRASEADSRTIATSSDGKTVNCRAFLELDALECPVCYELMDPPIFQCQNGHITCHSCHTKLSKCHTCSLPHGSTRCLALEKIVDSLKIPCPYASLGCEELVSYSKRECHRENCTKVPCHCPILGCRFSAPVSELLLHLGSEHSPLIIDPSFAYEKWLAVSFVGSSRHVRILVANDGALFIIICNYGSLSMVSIGPNSLKGKFTYRLKVKREKSLVEFESAMGVVQKVEEAFSNDFSLLVSRGFLDEQSKLMLEVRVSQKNQNKTP